MVVPAASEETVPVAFVLFAAAALADFAFGGSAEFVFADPVATEVAAFGMDDYLTISVDPAPVAFYAEVGTGVPYV